MPPRRYPGETIPKGLNRDEVIRLLATSEGGRLFDIRARAILMLLITYGLRAGEVSGLRVDDLDWEREMLRVRCPKPGRTHLYPLSRGVGQAILRYLREVRPVHPERRLFLTLKAPIRPLSRGVIKGIISARLDRLGITGKRCGPHALRHAAAQHLLDQGLSMKAVGDYLGHRSVAATSVYAKVQLDALREVADIDLEGLS
jgi:site-specific recombinase XerD